LSNRATIPSLDGIRAISILLVVLSHSGLDHVVPGRLGVTIFFFLSGYLITTLLLAEWRASGTVGISNFYARRAFRLMPPLIVTLAVAYGLHFAGLLPGTSSLTGFLSQLLYWANYYLVFADNDGQIPNGTGVLWSLAVEEHFYIVYPVAMLLLLRFFQRPSAITSILVSVCVAILLWRIHLIGYPGLPDHRLGFSTDTRADSIIFGCIFAISMNPIEGMRPGERMKTAQWAMLLAGLALLASTIVIRNPYFRETYRYTLQGIALVPMFYMAIRYAGDWPFRWLSWQPVVRIGVWSYAIYLINDVFAEALAARLPWLETAPLIYTMLVLGLSIAFAIAIDKIVDPYFRELRGRFRHNSGRPVSREPLPIA
jgi:peptidoglycan/LPS O-acetylase OafA/YrhL